MNTTIKKRIEEINSGRVPEGYEKTSFGIFPCDWEGKEIKDIAYLGKKKYDPTKSENNPICVELEHIISQRGMLNGYTYAKNQNSLKNVFCKGDILFGKLRPYLAKYYHADFEGVCSTEIWVIKSKENINNDFLYQLIKDEKFISNSQDSAFGTKMPRAEWAKVEKSICYLPASQKEQSRIAEILMQWDKAIELQEKYIKQLELRKKALMQRLLTPKEGWKEHSLGEVSKIEKGEQVNNLELSETGCFPMLNGGVAPSGYYYKANCKANTITISEGGNSCGYVNYMTEDFWSGGHCYTLSRVVIEKYYLFAYLKHIESKIMQMRVGSGLPNIQRSAIEKIKIYYPASIEEQKSIAEIFFNLDKIIVLQTKKLDKLIEQRKALQQYLLTGIVRV